MTCSSGDHIDPHRSRSLSKLHVYRGEQHEVLNWNMVRRLMRSHAETQEDARHEVHEQ